MPRKYNGNGRSAPRGPRPPHVRKAIGDAQRGVPKSEAHRAALKAARSREDRSPVACPHCDKGPFQGERGLKIHNHHRHPELKALAED